MPQFGRESMAALATCDERLRRLAEIVIKYADHCILQGARDEAQQRANVAAGVSQTMASKHLARPSLAFDFCPYHAKHGKIVGTAAQLAAIARFENKRLAEIESWCREQFTYVGGAYRIAGEMLSLPVTWGGDWNRDGNLLDNRFDDLGHVEIHAG